MRQQQEKAAAGGGRLPQATKKVGIADDNSREAAKNCCGSNKAPPQAEKAHVVCRPGRDELSIGKLQSFLSYFLYFTKSRTRPPQGGARLPQATKKVGIAAGRSGEAAKNCCAATKHRRRRKEKLLGRAKSCQWQVFVRRRPPKQGELRTDVSKATMFQGDGRQRI